MSCSELSRIAAIILDEECPLAELKLALDDFSWLCSQITGMEPDPSFDAWAEDSFLAEGVAINPQAAAHCIQDYQRTVAFIRGINAAINKAKARFLDTPIRILYAGCGPFASLLLPLLTRFNASELELRFLDIHACSLDSVRQLIECLGFEHSVSFVQADACRYQTMDDFHLVVAETMQKSLEQEPQFTVTANLVSTVCDGGFFIPESINVSLCLAYLENEQLAFKAGELAEAASLFEKGRRLFLATLLDLRADNAVHLFNRAKISVVTRKNELSPVYFVIPEWTDLALVDPIMLTHIRVFEGYVLNDYESEITLPNKCYEILPLNAGDRYQVSYQLGQYPKFNYERMV
jgi:hypothetical protein